MFKVESSKIFEAYSSKIKESELIADYEFVENPSCVYIFLGTMWTSFMAFFSTLIANSTDINFLW